MKTFFGVIFGSFVILFFSWFAVYKLGINGLAIQSEDTVPALFLPYSILQKGSLYLDDYYTQMLLRYPQPDDKDYVKGNVPFYLIKVDDHYLSAFTIITPLLALPVYIIPVLIHMYPTWETLTILSHISGALIISFASGILYLIFRKRLALSERNSILLCCIYSFATINYASISQAMWQHGTVQLLILVGLYFILGENLNRKQLLLTGLFWSFAFLARPTALLPIAVLSFSFTFYKNTKIDSIKKLLYILLGFVPGLLFFIYYNNTYYGSFSNQGYSTQLFTSWLGDFPISYLGVWLSPSKGILIYSPVIAFSLVGLYLTVRNRIFDHRFLYLSSGVIILLHTLVISFWKHWYGGWSFGYRMSSDVIPFMVLLLVPFITSNLYKKYFRLFLLSVFLSVLVQIFGIIFFDGIWHAAYDRGFGDTSWLWSIKDSEFAFNVRRILVKVGFLERACPKCL